MDLRGGLRREGVVARVRVTGHTPTTGKRNHTVTPATEETNTAVAAAAVAPPSGQSQNQGLVTE